MSENTAGSNFGTAVFSFMWIYLDYSQRELNNQLLILVYGKSCGAYQTSPLDAPKKVVCFQLKSRFIYLDRFDLRFRLLRSRDSGLFHYRPSFSISCIVLEDPKSRRKFWVCFPPPSTNALIEKLYSNVCSFSFILLPVTDKTIPG